ncbi:endolytic transglycosylase MltG [Corynebacterium yudongzhengii]|nr:endolytic transglycosylase MltG [Corynebacterium yudongzhengii]
MTKPARNRGFQRRMEPKYVKRRQRGLAVLIASFVLLIGAVVWIAVQLSGNANNPQAQVNDYEGTGNGVQQLVEIPEGAALAQLGPELEERDIVASDSAFQTAAANNPAAGNIQPGFYRLEEQMSASAAVDALTNPDNQVDLLDVHGGATLMDVVVVGGETRQGIYSQIAAVSSQGSADGSGVTVQELHEVAANVDPGELGAPEWALDRVRERGNDPRRLEGLIAPGQYVVDPSKSAQEVLTDLVSRSTKLYNETNIEERAGALNLSAYDLLTAASLIEREAPAGEFDKVARVILNRLEEPMRLEFDSTVNYGLDDVEVATTDEDRAEVTPWNTYAMDGLPQTPIASPSVEAIEAMENPAEGNWLFFVTVDEDGTTVFNDTFEEHLADVQRSADSGVLDSNR